MNIKFKNLTTYFKKGGGIHIKQKNKGSFTKYCKGKVTQECIDKAKKSGNKKLIKRSVFAENSRRWAKKHQMGGMMSQQQNPYIMQQITPQIMPGMTPIPQMYQYSSMPSMYPQQGLITNTQPNIVQNTQTSALDQYKQSLTQTDEALRAYDDKEAAKKKAAELKIEERNKKADSIGEQIGSVAGTIGMQFANNAYLKNQEKKGSMSNNMNKRITETTNQNLQGAKNFNTSFVKNAASDIASLQLPKITDTSFDLNSIVQTATNEAYHS